MPSNPAALARAWTSLLTARGPMHSAVMAQRDGQVPRNVARLARRPRIGQRLRGKYLEHWQPAELLRFRQYADSDPLAAVWRLTLSGMTRADVLGLRWSDVDLVAGVASVSQGRVALDRGDTTDETKSEAR